MPGVTPGARPGVTLGAMPAAHRPDRPIRRDEICELIDRDEAYDEDPHGEPPLLVARYRASLRAVLSAEPAEPGHPERAWSERERDAYRAGGRATHRLIVGAMATALTAAPGIDAPVNGALADRAPDDETPGDETSGDQAPGDETPRDR